jgi:hypothetical protein|tara:strand:- start:686 stop:1438 length:753 start_codon:yes stop_codon:yes gene_type:complete
MSNLGTGATGDKTLSGSDSGGTLFTTENGGILTGLTHGIVTLNFVSGNITDASGTITKMNTSLQIMSKEQCKSFTIFCSDADAVINVGNALTISDHQLNHTIHNYDFQQIQITVPNNSTPDENQIAFMASTDPYLNYESSANWHDRGVVSGTSVNAATNVYTKHVGAYEDFYITTYNSGSNSIELKIYFSEDGTTYFAESGYTSAVTITAGSYNAFATNRKHHFYRAEINSKVTDSHSNFSVYYNNVSVQ